jgi:hypothetical protein
MRHEVRHPTQPRRPHHDARAIAVLGSRIAGACRRFKGESARARCYVVVSQRPITLPSGSLK